MANEIPFLEERLRICAAARSYLGVPWQGQGRDRRGVDCSGIVVVSFRDGGFPIEEPKPDYRGVDQRRIHEVLPRYFQKLVLPRDGLFPADMVIYGVNEDMHFALLLDGAPLNAIHCPYEERVVEARFDPRRHKIRGFYRWRQFYSPFPS